MARSESSNVKLKQKCSFAGPSPAFALRHGQWAVCCSVRSVTLGKGEHMSENSAWDKPSKSNGHLVQIVSLTHRFCRWYMLVKQFVKYFVV